MTSGKGKHARITAACAGTFLESFDFFSWFLLASVITKSVAEDLSLSGEIFTTAIFAGTFIIRTFGASFFGSIGDRHGRAFALRLSTIMLGGGAGIFVTATTLQGNGSSYSAVIKFSIFRALQSFSSGAQVSGSTVYLAEKCSELRKERWQCRLASFTFISSGFGLLFALGSFVALKKFMPEEDLNAWAWRLPFASEILFMIFGVTCQHYMAETESFRMLVHDSLITMSPMEDTFRTDVYNMIILIFILSPFHMTYGLLFYFIPLYAVQILNHSLETAAMGLFVSILMHILSSYLGGIFGDTYGFLKTTIWMSMACFLSIVPLFQIFLTYPGNQLAYIICVGALSFLNGFGVSSIQILCISRFSNLSRRFTAFGITWNISACLFSCGFAILNTHIIDFVSPFFPALCITASSMITAIICRCYLSKVIDDTPMAEEESETTVITKDSMYVNGYQSDIMSDESRYCAKTVDRLQQMKDIICDQNHLKLTDNGSIIKPRGFRKV